MSEDINLTEGTVTEVLNNKVDIDFQNVPSNSVGFARCSTEVTNCTTSVPNRIKYTLVDGVLTILKGSIVVVPYGTEDLTSQFPVGSTFLDDNFKVVDTQWDGSKFFVWAELQNDVSKTSTDADKDLVVQFRIDRSESEPTWNLSGGYTNNFASGTTPPTNYKVYYQTDINKIFATTNTPLIYTLPFMITTGAFGNIKQVFNGFGYIGSTIWCDKDVKILIPNGRNKDGTLNNIEYTSTKIITSSSTSTQDYVIRLCANSSLAQRQFRYSLTVKSLEDLYKLNANTSYYVHVTDENFTYYTSNGEWIIARDVPIATATLTQGVVSNFQPKQPIRLASTDMVDGQWVAKPLSTTITQEGTYTIDLIDYLPDLNYDYEVIVRAGIINNVDGTNSYNKVTSDILTGSSPIVAGSDQNTGGINMNSTATLPVRRYLTSVVNGSVTSGDIAVYGYRRLGRNI